MRVTRPVSDPSIPTPKEFAEWFHAPPLTVESTEPQTWTRHRLIRLDALLAVAIFLGAIAVRLPLIQRGETLLHSDEAIVGLMAQDIAEGRSLPIFFYGQRYMGALEAYVIAAISCVVADPITALRLGPTLFFAALVTLQYLMLSRWFGRRGGIVGAAALLASGPMFAQWSISARGGYIEILLWGSALLWAYSEWFVPAAARPSRGSLHRFAFGLLIGSGLWINPSIVLFVVPIALHYMLNRPLHAALDAITQSPISAPRRMIARVLNRQLALPLLAFSAVVTLNSVWYVYVDGSSVRSEILLGHLPRGVAIGAILLVGAGLFAYTHRRFNLIHRARQLATPAAPLMLGILIGAAPALLYVVEVVLGMREMDPSLPLGIRPIWKLQSTLDYFLHGVPLLFGADARPFLDLVTIGRAGVFKPLDIMTAGVLAAANWLVLGAAMTAVMILWLSHRQEINRLLRLRAGIYSPTLLLVIGAAVTTALYLLSGAAHDFNTIRYLIPLWAFVPGLLAAIAVSQRFRLGAIAACSSLFVGWAFGQFAMYQQLGNPHPLRAVADELVAHKVDPAVAEIFDAHLLSYMTGQKCRLAEFDPFWSRLSHYQEAVSQEGPVTYVVPTVAATFGYNTWNHPGPPPPELSHPMPRRIDLAVAADPDLVVGRNPLPGGYELVVLARPLTKTAPRP
jgi:hypothetical protein